MAVEGDSYTTQADVEKLVGRGAHTASTVPTQAEVLEIMAKRGAKVQSVMWDAGLRVTPPTGAYPISSAAGLDASAKDMVTKLANEANALLAAGWVIWAHSARDEDPPPKSVALWEEAKTVLEALAVASTGEGAGPGERTHTTTGGVAKGDFPGSVAAASEPDARALWGLDTKW